jgi:hypothetical protein
MRLMLRFMLLSSLLALTIVATGCNDDFFLSEKETRAYAGMLATESSATTYFDNLQGRSINLTFDNSSGTPSLLSTNLLTEMRRTEMAQLETGPAAVSLPRLKDELEKQLRLWIDGRLLLYTSPDDRVKLTSINGVTATFLSNPTFHYRPELQTIEFDAHLHLTIDGSIEVNAVNSILNWVLNIFGSGVNGTYPLIVELYDLRLHGEAHLLSPYSNAGRVRFLLTPELVPVQVGPVQVTMMVRDNGGSSPQEVRQGIGDLLRHNLSTRVDEIFTQDYYYFALPYIGLSATTPSQLSVVYKSKVGPYGPESTNPVLHVVTRASDGKLYHGRKGDTGWTSYTSIPFPSPSPTPYPTIIGDPMLCYSGAGQMELAATDEAGDLVYAHWRDEAWGNFQLVKPNTAFNPAVRYLGKPAIATSGPGQAEIISRGSDGKLWHLRRVNGVWIAPAMVPLNNFPQTTAPFRDPVAVQAGNKIVLVFVDSQNRIQGMVYDLETSAWGQPAPFPTSPQTPTVIGSQAPTAVASGDERVDVVYLDSSGTPKHRIIEVRSNNLNLTFNGNETVIGGTLNSSPVLVAGGYRQLDLIGRVAGNKLRHNHFVYATAPFQVDGRTVNPGWQGWTDLNANLSAAGAIATEQFTDFGVAATPTGRVELVGRSSVVATTTQQIFHNNFESPRYGSAPWKTVQWRGYEASGLTTATGRPAIVAIDRNFQIGAIGNGAIGTAFNYGRISASNATNYYGGPTARAISPVVDPIVLSSGPALVDYIYISDTGRLTHFRKYSESNARTFTPAAPAGVTIKAISAQSYGNGYIELAALGNNNCIYHWRFRDGAWSSATGVACGMSSAPALVYTGAGKIELLAVDPDHRLYRWRLLGTTWMPRLQISSTFRISENHFSKSAVSSWGDGTIDVVVVDLDTRALAHRRIGPDDEICTQPFGCPAPRVFTNLGGSVADKPVLTAFSAVNLNVLVMQGLQWYSSWASAERLQPVTIPPRRDLLLRWSVFEYIGGSEMVVGGTAHSGIKNYAAVATHFDGRILVNRFENGRWTSFQPVVGQRPWMQLTSPVILPSIAAYAGR